MDYKKLFSQEKEKFARREKDWRNGAVIYQVIVDRFAPSKQLNEKKAYYKYPRKLNDWNDEVKPGVFLNDVKYWSHELEFWGGDLKSLASKLDYIKDLNIDVLYLNPIHKAVSNHKYDSLDYLQVSEEYGSFEDLKELINKTHNYNMKIVLDGVFNHMAISSDLFTKANNNDPKFRNWFYFGKDYPEGTRLWANVQSLPELNFENEDVKKYIYIDDDSVTKTYLKLGIDGWRLDVAFELGYEILADLSDHLHSMKSDFLIVGEIWNYPKTWIKSIDGIMNFTLREIILEVIKGTISPKKATTMISKMIEDAGDDVLLKCWNLIDNHDIPRLKHTFPNELDQRIAQIMQFTLPGSPNLYYGTELGMTGGNDPRNRAPMNWALNTGDNKQLSWTKQLISLHQTERALKIGDYLTIDSENFIAYERITEKVEETVIVIINPRDEKQKENLLIPDSNLMHNSRFIDLLDKNAKPLLQLKSGILEVTLDKKSFLVIKPSTTPHTGYTPYKRIN